MIRTLLILVTAAVCLAPAAIASSEETGTEASEVDTVALAELSAEELFLRSSSAALQFAPMIQPSRRVLVREYDRSLPYLITQLDTDGPRERHALEDILVRIGEPAVEPLIDALGEELERTDTLRGARMAAGILGRLDDERATPALCAAARHADWKVRSSVASALGRVGSADGVDGLVRLLADRNEIVRKSAAVAIRRMATEPEPPKDPTTAPHGDTEQSADPEDAAEEYERLLARHDRSIAARNAVMDDVVVRALVRALGDNYYHVRYSAASALTGIGSDALPLLIGVANVGRGPERLMALSAIGSIGDDSALGPLNELLEDESWTVRAFAAEAIGKIVPDRRARKALSKLLASEDHPFVSMRAGDALAPME